MSAGVLPDGAGQGGIRVANVRGCTCSHVGRVVQRVFLFQARHEGQQATEGAKYRENDSFRHDVIFIIRSY